MYYGKTTKELRQQHTMVCNIMMHLDRQYRNEEPLMDGLTRENAIRVFYDMQKLSIEIENRIKALKHKP